MEREKGGTRMAFLETDEGGRRRGRRKTQAIDLRFKEEIYRELKTFQFIKIIPPSRETTIVQLDKVIYRIPWRKRAIIMVN